MRISDWSSDVCSSDLIISLAVAEGADGVKVGTVIALLAAEGEDTGAAPSKPAKAEKSEKAQATESKPAAPQPRPAPELAKSADASSIASEKARSEERRVGKEGVGACRSRWAPYH